MNLHRRIGINNNKNVAISKSIIRIELFEKQKVESFPSFNKSIEPQKTHFKVIQIESSLEKKDLEFLMYIFNNHNSYFYRIFFLYDSYNDILNSECIVFENSIIESQKIEEENLKKSKWIENSNYLKSIHSNFSLIFSNNIEIIQKINMSIPELEKTIINEILVSKNLLSYQVLDLIILEKKTFNDNFYPSLLDLIQQDNTDILKEYNTRKTEDNNTSDIYKDVYEYIYRSALLTKEQIESFKKYFETVEKRIPSLLEVHFFAQSWSEHCCHNIFSYQLDDIEDGLYHHYIKRGTNEIMQKKDLCISVFSDNAGSFIFDDKYSITVKVETHNSPCVIDPFKGAMTGVLGVNRDIIGFGIGAKPISNMFCFCLPDLNFYKNNGKKTKVVPNDTKELLDGITFGVNQGGNLSGIPTIHGSLHFDKGYRGKPLVFVGTIGIIPLQINNKLSHKKKVEDGDCIVILGSRTGRDGVHGATFSSGGITNTTTNNIPSGDPYTQKITSDLIIKEALRLDLYNAITDIGAGGFSSSVGEMGEKGFYVNLNNVITKTSKEHYTMEAWEIWISETQERMTLSVPEKNIKSLKELAKLHGVTMYVIGTFNYSGRGIIEFNNKIVSDISLNFLKKGNPKLKLTTEGIILEKEEYIVHHTKSAINVDLENILKDENICSNKFLFEQYDHEVQSISTLKPLQGTNKINGDSSVIRPILDSNKGLASSHSLCTIQPNTEAYQKVKRTIDNAIRKLIVTGANPDKITLLDNFCWADPYNKTRLLQLKQSCIACYDVATLFETPFISGKDSMFNQRSIADDNKKTTKIFYNNSTLLITATGIIEDINNIISPDVKYINDEIYAIGNFTEKHFNILQNKKIYSKYYKCLMNGYISSAITVDQDTIYGDIIALTKKSIASGIGIECDFSYLPESNNMLPLIFVSIRPEISKKFLEIIGSNLAIRIGTVSNNKKISIKFRDNSILEHNLNNLLEIYHKENNIKHFI